MKVLILGCNGQLGRCLNDQLATTQYDVVFTSRDSIDISDFEATRVQVAKISPDVVINATAYTAVDKAEEEKEKAEIVNHLAVANIADICSSLGSWLIHVSTDYVFDGSSVLPYREDDKTNPQCVYGETKLKGELAIQNSGCRYLIIRTAWVFSEYGNNFLKTMLSLGSRRDTISIVNDQIGCPTYGQDIAKMITSLLCSLFNGIDQQGIYHYCGETPCSWYEFATKIFDQARIYGFKIPDSLEGVATAQYPTLAKRPMFSVLDNHKVYERFSLLPSNWELGIDSALLKLSHAGKSS